MPFNWALVLVITAHLALIDAGFDPELLPRGQASEAPWEPIILKGLVAVSPVTRMESEDATVCYNR